MKTFYPILLLVFFLITSCGNNKTKNQEPNPNQQNEETTLSKEEATSKTADASNIKTIKDCDTYLDQYEKWAYEYIDFIDKYMKNPGDPDLLTEYTNKAKEFSNWAGNWLSLSACINDEKYEKRFEQIGKNIDGKLNELGLN